MRDSSKSRCQAGVISLKMWNGFPVPTLLRVIQFTSIPKMRPSGPGLSRRRVRAAERYIQFCCTQFWQNRAENVESTVSVIGAARRRWRQCVDFYRTDIRALTEFDPNFIQIRQNVAKIGKNLVDSFKENAALIVSIFTKLTPTVHSLSEDRLYSFPPSSAEKCKQTG